MQSIHHVRGRPGALQAVSVVIFILTVIAAHGMRGGGDTGLMNVDADLVHKCPPHPIWLRGVRAIARFFDPEDEAMGLDCMSFEPSEVDVPAMLAQMAELRSPGAAPGPGAARHPAIANLSVHSECPGGIPGHALMELEEVAPSDEEEVSSSGSPSKSRRRRRRTDDVQAAAQAGEKSGKEKSARDIELEVINSRKTGNPTVPTVERDQDKSILPKILNIFVKVREAITKVRAGHMNTAVDIASYVLGSDNCLAKLFFIFFRFPDEDDYFYIPVCSGWGLESMFPTEADYGGFGLFR